MSWSEWRPDKTNSPSDVFISSFCPPLQGGEVPWDSDGQTVVLLLPFILGSRWSGIQQMPDPSKPVGKARRAAGSKVWPVLGWSLVGTTLLRLNLGLSWGHSSDTLSYSCLESGGINPSTSCLKYLLGMEEWRQEKKLEKAPWLNHWNTRLLCSFNKEMSRVMQGSREYASYKLHKMLYCQVCVCLCQRVLVNRWHQTCHWKLGWHHQERAKCCPKYTWQKTLEKLIFPALCSYCGVYLE